MAAPNLPALLCDFIVFTNDKEGLIQFLKDKHLIMREPPECHCGRQMTFVKRSDILDGYTWRCPDHKGSKLSIRHNSWFANHNLSLKVILSIAYLWCQDVPQNSVMSMLGIGSEAAVDWFQFCRDICSWYLLQNPIVLGGNNVIVQIDESLIWKRKYNVGHAVAQQWIFGLYDTTLHIGIVQFVRDRSAETLIPIIQRHCAPNTIIHSDMWAAYNSLNQLPQNYTHTTVNHSTNFVDPITGTHTNHVESFWNSIKRKLKYITGSTREHVPSYIDEYIWRKRFGGSHNAILNNFLSAIVERYNLN